MLPKIGDMRNIGRFSGHRRRSQRFGVLLVCAPQNCNKPEHTAQAPCLVPVTVTAVHVAADRCTFLFHFSPSLRPHLRPPNKRHDISPKHALERKLLPKNHDMRNIRPFSIHNPRSERFEVLLVCAAQNCNKPEHAAQRVCPVPITVTAVHVAADRCNNDLAKRSCSTFHCDAVTVRQNQTIQKAIQVRQFASREKVLTKNPGYAEHSPFFGVSPQVRALWSVTCSSSPKL